jgi:hypothetical protein
MKKILPLVGLVSLLAGAAHATWTSAYGYIGWTQYYYNAGKLTSLRFGVYDYVGGTQLDEIAINDNTSGLPAKQDLNSAMNTINMIFDHNHRFSGIINYSRASNDRTVYTGNNFVINAAPW